MGLRPSIACTAMYWLIANMSLADAGLSSGKTLETYITNKAGRVLYRVQGAVSWDDPEVRRRIDQLLAS